MHEAHYRNHAHDHRGYDQHRRDRADQNDRNPDLRGRGRHIDHSIPYGSHIGVCFLRVRLHN